GRPLPHGRNRESKGSSRSAPRRQSISRAALPLKHATEATTRTAPAAMNNPPRLHWASTPERASDTGTNPTAANISTLITRPSSARSTRICIQELNCTLTNPTPSPITASRAAMAPNRADQHGPYRGRRRQHPPGRKAVGHGTADEHQRRAWNRGGHQDRAQHQARPRQLQREPGQGQEIELIAEQRDRDADPQVAEMRQREGMPHPGNRGRRRSRKSGGFGGHGAPTILWNARSGEDFAAGRGPRTIRHRAVSNESRHSPPNPRPPRYSHRGDPVRGRPVRGRAAGGGGGLRAFKGWSAALGGRPHPRPRSPSGRRGAGSGGRAAGDGAPGAAHARRLPHLWRQQRMVLPRLPQAPGVPAAVRAGDGDPAPAGGLGGGGGAGGTGREPLVSRLSRLRNPRPLARSLGNPAAGPRPCPTRRPTGPGPRSKARRSWRIWKPSSGSSGPPRSSSPIRPTTIRIT